MNVPKGMFLFPLHLVVFLMDVAIFFLLEGYIAMFRPSRIAPAPGGRRDARLRSQKECTCWKGGRWSAPKKAGRGP